MYYALNNDLSKSQNVKILHEINYTIVAQSEYVIASQVQYQAW